MAPDVEISEKKFELPETTQEVSEPVQETPAEQEAPTPAVPPEPVQPIQPAASTKDRLHIEIESVLEEDMTDLFLKLPENKREEFKTKGEETASKIRQIVQKSRINARKIFGLIKDWLKMVPGVNKLFLEQEAKIKTDKILLITEEERQRGVEEIT